MRPIPVVFDMETNDPDDFLTLLLLLGHPAVSLRAVTVMPGSAAQIGLVRRALSWFSRDDVRVGAHDLDHPKSCVSPWHHTAYGTHAESREAEAAGPLLLEVCDAQTTLITGAPLKNLAIPVADPDFRLGRWVAQGGFAGVGVVPEELQLPQFRGKRTCATFNFNGAPQVALAALAHPGITQRDLVSKNVCHGVIWDEAMHAAIAPRIKGVPYLERMWHGMEVLLQKYRETHQVRPVVSPECGWTSVRLVDNEASGEAPVVSLQHALRQAHDAGGALTLLDANHEVPVCTITPATSQKRYGKKLHDPLAACCAIDPEIGTWREVELFRKRGEWGANLAPGSHTRIIIAHDHARFIDVLCGASPETTTPPTTTDSHGGVS